MSLVDGDVDASDAALDGGTPPDASEAGAPDATPDAAPDASGPDPDPPPPPSCPCPADTTCLTWTCTADEVCVSTSAMNGTECGESMGADICVEGACVVRGCGDGYHEPGPTPEPEECDDGNTVGGDGCSVACAVEMRVIAADPTAESDIYVADGSRPIGVDAQGRALVVYAIDDFMPGSGEAYVRLVAQRYQENGAVQGTPLVLDANLIASPPVATPTVVGLANGWAVAWTAYRAGTYDVVLRVVQPNGAVGIERLVNQTRGGVQRRPAMTPLAGGFVVAWESTLSTLADPDGGVYARRFTASGMAFGNEMPLMSSTAGMQSDVTIASNGDYWLAVWTDQQLANDYAPELRMRRFELDTPRDVTQLAPFSAKSAEADAIEYGGEGFLVAYRTTHVDAAGDIESVVVPLLGPPAMPAVLAGEAGVPERSPSIVALYYDVFLIGITTAPQQATAVMNVAEPIPHLDTLRASLAATSATRVSLVLSPHGLWAVWQSSGLVGGGYGAAAMYWPNP